MGLTYYAGNKLHLNNFCKGIECSEYIWGYIIWFFLLSTLLHEAVSKSVQRVDIQDHCDIQTLDSRMMNQLTFKVIFEFIHGLLSIIFAMSVMFYSLVEQADVRNKTQSFFGMQMGFLILFTSQMVVMTKWLSKPNNIMKYKENKVAEAGEPWTLPVNNRSMEHVSVNNNQPTRSETRKMEGSSSSSNEEAKLSRDQGRSNLQLLNFPSLSKPVCQGIIRYSYMHVLLEILNVLILILSLISVFGTLLFVLYSTVRNYHSPRLINCTSECKYS